MASVKVKIYFDGELAKILRGESSTADIDPALDDLAAAIAGAVEIPTHPDAEIMVRKYKTDRSARAVTIAEPYGLPVEAIHGPLRKAAAANGLEVQSKKRKRSRK